ASFQLSQYSRNSFTAIDPTDRSPNHSFNSLVSNLYFPTDASFLRSQSFKNRSHASESRTLSVFPSSHSRARCRATSQFLVPNDFRTNFPPTFPCTQIGHPHLRAFIEVWGQLSR